MFFCCSLDTMQFFPFNIIYIELTSDLLPTFYPPFAPQLLKFNELVFTQNNLNVLTLKWPENTKNSKILV